MPNMKLSEMQDIGGCRAVLRTLKQAIDLRDLYYKRRSNFERVGAKDYITEPKPSGYRSIHLIHRYKSGRADSRTAYDGHLIEIQIRSLLQHSWATAVETVGTIIGDALKSAEGSGDWLDLFRYISALFAIAEGTTRIPNTPSKTQLIKLVRSDSKRLRMVERLDSFRKALKIIEKYRTRESRYFLLDLNPVSESLVVIGYREGELEQATQQYLSIERSKSRAQGSDVVLVRANSIESLRRSYPNYFLDTEYFLKMVKELTSR